MTRRGAQCGFGATTAPWKRRFSSAKDALKHVQPDMRLDELGLLGAFDANRDMIQRTATRVYGRGQRGSYDLHYTDF